MVPLGFLMLVVPAPEPAMIPHEDPVSLTVNAGAVTVPATVPASINTVGEALSLLALPAQGALVAPDPTTPLQPEMHISIVFPKAFVLHDGINDPKTFFAFGASVGEGLAENGIELGSLDRLSPLSDTLLEPNIAVHIVRVLEFEREEAVPIAFPTVTENNAELSYGKERTVQEGIKGRAQERVRVREENGKVVARNILERSVLDEPVPKIMQRGTRIVIGRIQEGGASWYSYKGCNCAASTTFPKGSFVRVTNLENGKHIIVRINDYGPTAPGRVVDLDTVAFKTLQPLWKGLFSARVEEILP